MLLFHSSAINETYRKRNRLVCVVLFYDIQEFSCLDGKNFLLTFDPHELFLHITVVEQQAVDVPLLQLVYLPFPAEDERICTLDHIDDSVIIIYDKFYI